LFVTSHFRLIKLTFASIVLHPPQDVWGEGRRLGSFSFTHVLTYVLPYRIWFPFNNLGSPYANNYLSCNCV